MTTTWDNGHGPILVVGASGKTGRRVVEGLRARGVPVRRASRTGDVAFDWEDPETWGPALEGARSCYLTYYPDLAVPGARDAVETFTRLALDRGVRRLVLLSGRGEVEAQRAEDVLQHSGAAWTILRCSWFSQNFSENFWLEPLLAGEIALPAGDVPVPFVDADDIADVAVASLTEPFHVGELYELTGPRSLTFADAVREIADAVDRPIEFVPIPMADFQAAMKADGVPEDVAALVTYLFEEVLVPANAQPANGVERALGRPARDFGDWARATAATGVWHVEQPVVAAAAD